MTRSMLQIAFDKEKERDEQQETDQNPIAAFVVLAVQWFVFSVNKNTGRNKSHQKKPRENQLSLCKHCG